MTAVYVVGDVHLRGDGHAGDAGFLAFLRHLATQPAARLVILGDLVEYWIDGPIAIGRYAEVLSALARLRASGWRLDLVQGNRELVGGRRLEAAVGTRMQWPRLDLRLGAVRVRIVHGDRLCHDPGYHLFAAWLRSFWHRSWQQLFPNTWHEWVAQGLRRRSQAKQKRDRQRIRSRVFIDPRRVVGAAHGVDLLLAGHIHESWRRHIRGVDLTLVGDWPGSVGHWCELDADGRLFRRCWDFQNGSPPAARAADFTAPATVPA